MTNFLYRLGRLCARRHRTVLVVWPLIALVVIGAAILGAGALDSSSTVPGSPAQAASVRMQEHFPTPDVQSAQIVFQAPPGSTVSDPTVRAPLEQTLAAVVGTTGVTEVSDPYADGSVSPDGRTAVAEVTLSTPGTDVVDPQTLTALERTADPSRSAGTTVAFSGDAFVGSPAVAGTGELLGILIALAVLVITFGSLLSAGMPLVTAVVGVLVSVGGMLALTSVASISDSAPTLAVMLGLAVGIDYALFIVSRHRSQLAAGTGVEESIARATATAGGAVVFAGATVVIALCGLTVARFPTLTSMGLVAAGAVGVAVVMSLTLLPALLAVVGPRMVPRPGSRTVRRLQQTTTPTMGTRWVGAVTRRPVRTLVVGVGLLLVLAAPVVDLQLALSDGGSQAQGTPARQSYDLVADAFGPGTNGPLIVLVTGDDPTTVSAAAAEVAARVSDLPGVAAVSPVDTATDGAAARVRVTPTTGPRDAATGDLVTRLGAATAPLADGTTIAVTGQTAVSIDVSSTLRSSLVPFALVVVALSMVLLLLAFRSVAVPLKATVGFLLSLGAALGTTVAVFQWGWAADLLGLPSTGPISSFAPIIVVAVLFGLAMDYEVFLVSAVREDYLRTRDAQASITTGARSTARVVTAAALIMVAVFAGFLPSANPNVMPIAFALAVGVLIDAFVVRMTLVPAVLTLLGDRAWTLPRWLDRITPHLGVDGCASSHPGDTHDASHTAVPAHA